MINLFNIPNYQINTANFNHYLHGDVCKEFENNFCEYVGAKYACTINSATNAINSSNLTKKRKASENISNNSGSGESINSNICLIGISIIINRGSIRIGNRRRASRQYNPFCIVWNSRKFIERNDF